MLTVCNYANDLFASEVTDSIKINQILFNAFPNNSLDTVSITAFLKDYPNFIVKVANIIVTNKNKVVYATEVNADNLEELREKIKHIKNDFIVITNFTLRYGTCRLLYITIEETLIEDLFKSYMRKAAITDILNLI